MLLDVLLGGVGKRLLPRDAEFQFTEHSGHLSHLVAVHLFDVTDHPEAELDYAQATAWMAERLSAAPFFTHRIQREVLNLDYPYWVSADVDLAEHLFVHEVQEPGWEPVSRYLSRVVGAPVDLTRPPWEMHLVTGVSGLDDMPGRLVAAVLKIHHSAGDGLAVQALTEKIYSSTWTPAKQPPEAAPPRRIGMALRTAVGLPSQVMRLIRGVRTTSSAVDDIAEAEGSGILTADQQLPSTPLNGLAGDEIVIGFVSFPLNDIQAIKKAVPGATVNDVLLATVSEALQAHLQEIGEKATPLAAKVPRSLRTVEQWSSANQLALLSVRLHNEVLEPLDRLTSIAASSRQAKERSEHFAVRAQRSRIETAPALLLWLTSKLKRVVPQPENPTRTNHSMVSNIPLRLDGLDLCGAPCVGVLANQPPVDRDLVRHFMCRGKDGLLTVNVCASVAVMPNLPRYLTLLRDAFANLRETKEGSGLGNR